MLVRLAVNSLRPGDYFPVLPADGTEAGAGGEACPGAAGLMPYFSRMGLRSEWT